MSDPAAASPPGSWRHRRRIIHASLIYCAGVVVWIIARGRESPMESQIAIALIGLATTIIVTYALGAVWDDKNARKTGA